MTWSFAAPDGRALFRLAEVNGETVVVWLRVGVGSSGVAVAHNANLHRTLSGLGIHGLGKAEPAKLAHRSSSSSWSSGERAAGLTSRGRW